MGAMIGIYAVLWHVAFLVLGLFLFVGSGWGAIFGGREKPIRVFDKNDAGPSTALLAVAAIGLAMLAGVGNLMIRDIRFHSDLSCLRAESVSRIEVGSQAVTDRHQIAEVVAILNQPEWSDLRRGDAADQVPFVIRLANGAQYRYSATRYQHGEGAALVSHSPSGWQNGEVLCRKLPAVLAKAGITLPPCYTYFGKPLHCALQ